MGNCLSLLSFPHSQARQTYCLFTLNRGFIYIIFKAVLSPVAASCPAPLGTPLGNGLFMNSCPQFPETASLLLNSQLCIANTFLPDVVSLTEQGRQPQFSMQDIKQFILSIGLDKLRLCPIPSESSASVKQCQHNTAPLHMEAKADWTKLRMGWSQNLLWGRESWPPPSPGRPRAGRVHQTRQLTLARGCTRTNSKGTLGHHGHTPETVCPSYTFDFPSKLYLGFMPVGQRVKEDVPSATLWRPL